MDCPTIESPLPPFNRVAPGPGTWRSRCGSPEGGAGDRANVLRVLLHGTRHEGLRRQCSVGSRSVGARSIAFHEERRAI
jgi:hypothetical protein